jgi:hypothetical protein
MQARTDLARLKYKQQKREWVPLSETEALIQILVAQAIFAFDSLPARIAKRYEDRQRVETVCDEVRHELADSLDRKWAEWYAENKIDRQRRRDAGEHLDKDEDSEDEDED